MIRETKRLLTKKILHFDNVWFIWHTTPWSLLVMENILAMEIEVWIRFWAAKAVNGTGDIRLNTPHGPAPLEESPTLEGEAGEDRKNIVERYEHTSDFLSLDSSLISSYERESNKVRSDKETNLVNTQEWKDRYVVGVESPHWPHFDIGLAAEEEYGIICMLPFHSCYDDNHEDTTKRYDDNSDYYSSYILSPDHKSTAIIHIDDNSIRSSCVDIPCLMKEHKEFGVDSNHIRYDFIYHGANEVRRAQHMCSEWK
jgi:hypothetical protein